MAQQPPGTNGYAAPAPFVSHLPITRASDVPPSLPPAHLKGHKTFPEMVRGHIHNWRTALKHEQIDAEDCDRSYIAHELRALDEIEDACLIEMKKAFNK